MKKLSDDLEYYLQKEKELKNSIAVMEITGIRMNISFQCINCGWEHDELKYVYPHLEYCYKIQ